MTIKGVVGDIERKDAPGEPRVSFWLRQVDGRSTGVLIYRDEQVTKDEEVEVTGRIDSEGYLVVETITRPKPIPEPAPVPEPAPIPAPKPVPEPAPKLDVKPEPQSVQPPKPRPQKALAAWLAFSICWAVYFASRFARGRSDAGYLLFFSLAAIVSVRVMLRRGRARLAAASLAAGALLHVVLYLSGNTFDRGEGLVLDVVIILAATIWAVAARRVSQPRP